MNVRIVDSEGDEILPVEGRIRIPTSESNWSISIGPEPPPVIYIKTRNRAWRLLNGPQGFQVQPSFRRQYVGRLDLFEDSKCRRRIASVYIEPLLLDEADFDFLLKDLQRLAIDAESPFHAILEMSVSQLAQRESLALLDAFLAMFRSELLGLIDSYWADLEATVDVLPLNHAVKRLPPRTFGIKTMSSSQSIRSLVRRPTDTGPKLRFLAAMTAEVITFTKTEIRKAESDHRDDLGRNQDSLKCLASINQKVKSLVHLIRPTLGLNHPSHESNDVLLDDGVLRLRTLWRQFGETWNRQVPAPEAPSRAGHSPDTPGATEGFGVAKTAALYERWFAALLFNGLRSRGFLIVDGSLTPYDMYEFVSTSFGLELSLRKGCSDRPIELIKDTKHGPLRLSMWIEPWVTKNEVEGGLVVIGSDQKGAKHPDLLIKLEFRGETHWAAVDCKFITSDTVRVEAGSLRKRYLEQLKSDSCWMIHPHGDLVNNWSRMKNPRGWQPAELFRLERVRESIFKIAPTATEVLTLFFFRFFEETRRISDTCWGCGGEPETTPHFDFVLHLCRHCRIGWSVKSCQSCRLPFVTTVRVPSLEPINPLAYGERFHFYCLCGSADSFVNSHDFGSRSTQIDKILHQMTGRPPEGRPHL